MSHWKLDETYALRLRCHVQRRQRSIEMSAAFSGDSEKLGQRSCFPLNAFDKSELHTKKGKNESQNFIKLII